MALIEIKRIDEAPELRLKIKELEAKHKEEIEKLESKNSELKREIIAWENVGCNFFLKTGLWDCFKLLEKNDKTWFQIKPKEVVAHK